jgi:hypothetical protein
VKLDPLLLIPAILRLVKRVLQEINNLGVRFCFFLLTASQSITDELRETERVDQHNKYNDCQSSVPAASICNPPNQTKTRVKQETVLPCARLLLIVARPDLHIPTVLHARSLPVVVSQVPIINFCEHFMSITSISMSACFLGLQLFFDLLYLDVKLVPLLLCLQPGLIRLRSVLWTHQQHLFQQLATFALQ